MYLLLVDWWRRLTIVDWRCAALQRCLATLAVFPYLVSRFSVSRAPCPNERALSWLGCLRLFAVAVASLPLPVCICEQLQAAVGHFRSRSAANAGCEFGLFQLELCTPKCACVCVCVCLRLLVSVHLVYQSCCCLSTLLSLSLSLSRSLCALTRFQSLQFPISAPPHAAVAQRCATNLLSQRQRLSQSQRCWPMPAVPLAALPASHSGSADRSSVI